MPPETASSTTTKSASSSAQAAQDPPPSDRLREPTEWAADQSWKNRERAEGAVKRAKPVVEALFREAGLTFPPAQLLFRVFKDEGHLELWAASQKDDALVKVATYRICYASGTMGPKRKEGDRQVPEGFYTLTAFTSTWKYHLMMYINYPNTADKIRSGPNPGGEIYLHGNCVSIGCIAMGDERIEELWVAASALDDQGGKVHIHIFPTRDMAGLIASEKMPEHKAFWENLKEGLDIFEEKRRIPEVSIGEKARYVFKMK